VHNILHNFNIWIQKTNILNLIIKY
jgi:hypothetical protein